MKRYPEEKKRERREAGIRFRVLWPMLLLLVVQCAVLLFGLSASGLMRDLDATTRDVLDRTVRARTDYLQYDMVNRWCNVALTVNTLNDLYDGFAQQGIGGEALYTEPKNYEEFLGAAGAPLIQLMRRNAVTGAFVMLRAGALPADENTVEQLPTLYLRDRDPVSSYNSGNGDLLLERAPISVVSRLTLSTDSTWKPLCAMSAAKDNTRAFFYPYRAALENPTLSYDNLAYWAPAYKLDDDQYACISYSVPLIADDGTLYGVLGVEIMTDYFERQLNADELAENGGAYVLCSRESADGPLTVEALDSKNYRWTDETMQGFTAVWDEAESVYHVSSDALSEMSAISGTFELYNANTPYSDEQWMLFGVVPNSALHTLSNTTSSTLLLLMVATMIAGILVAALIAFQISQPIARLEKEVRSGAKSSRLQPLTHTNVRELDSLAQAVTMLSSEVARAAGQLTRVMELSSVQLGVFEMDLNAETVLVNASFFRVFGRAEGETVRMRLDDFITMMRTYSADVQQGDAAKCLRAQGECVYALTRAGTPVWVRLKTVSEDRVVTGIVEDVTKEWKELRRLEFERDHDALTGIYNRRAFYEKYRMLFETGKIGEAALVMMDLDNLKYVNDTYGHDSGDAYICKAAQCLAYFNPRTTLVARMSGDEFMALFFGASPQELIRQIDQLEKRLNAASMTLPDGRSYAMRASAGVAWYPRDTQDPALLTRYADFAMYKGKHSTKGSFVDFDAESYRREAYLLQGKEALDHMIEQRLVQYHFQPIVDARTGAVFAYEALMRPQEQTLRSPLDVLTLARQESKLGAIEKLTWFCAMDAFVSCCEKGIVPAGCRVFINSISNQMLSAADLAEFERRFAPWLSCIVQEHTEEEQSNPLFLQRKSELLRRWNARLALDDYGSGYNGENILVTTAPDYIKVDIGIVRGVDTDENKRQMVTSLLEYTRPRGIRVIAEGVERPEEVRVLQALGVDYFQGYFFAKPAAVPGVPGEASVRFLHEA